MPSWVATPSVETVLLISMVVGGFWCIFVCICQIVRRAAKTARKNTAIYRRDSSRQSSRHGGTSEHSSTAPLHHGATQLQEAHPLRPLFVSSRCSAPSSGAGGFRPSNPNRNQSIDSVGFSARGGRLTSPSDEIIYPDYVERVILPEYVDRMESPCGEDSIEMNEEPPPYDAVEEHMDFPSPPAYNDLFPYKT